MFPGRDSRAKIRVQLLFLVSVMALAALIVLIIVRSPHEEVPPQASAGKSEIIISPLATPLSVTSQFPENTPGSFVFPPLASAESDKYDPYEIINQIDPNLDNLLQKDGNRPNLRLEHGSTLAAIDMNFRPAKTSAGFPYATLWLNASQPFRGVCELLPFYSKDLDQPQEFILKALMDGREIKLAIKGQPLSDRITLHLKSGERTVFEFETEPLPVGVHNFSIIDFDYATDTNPDPGVQAFYSGVFRSYPFKVFVGTTDSYVKLDWSDWSVGPNPFPGLTDYTSIIDLEETKHSTGLAQWKPGVFQPGEKVNYNIGIVNADKNDREYCFLAFLDYKVVPIQDNKNQICGIVRGEQWGVINASLVTPLEQEPHHLEVVEIENPLMKESYLQARPKQELSSYKSTGRVLINVQEK